MAAPMEWQHDIPTSSSRSVGKKEMKKMKKDEEDVREWLSYYGMSFEPYERLNVFVVQMVESDPSGFIYEIDGLNAPPKAVPFLGSFKPTFLVEVMGSFDGKVALYQDGLAYLFDPTTPGEGTLVKIPELLRIPGFSGGFNPGSFGVYYDYVEDEYMGLVCDLQTNSDPIMTFICVLSFKRGTCAFISQFDLPKLSPVMRRTATVANGVPYWVCDDLTNQSILKFDQTEQQLVALPCVPHNRDVQKLGTLDGQLTATVHYNKKIEIWSLECCDPTCTGWIPLFVLPEKAQSFSTISWMIKDVEVLLKDGGGKLVVYNFREGRLRQLSLVMQRKIKGSRWITVAYKPIKKLI